MRKQVDCSDDMPAEIDFSKGTRGKCFKPGTTLKLPVYLNPEVEAYLTARRIRVHETQLTQIRREEFGSTRLN